MNTTNTENRSAYWDEFYSGLQASELRPPSQFAAFCIGEVAKPDTVIVDIGCGTGRDALFFSSHGYHVVGVDASSEAISRCTSIRTPAKSPPSFIQSNIGSEDLLSKIENSAPYRATSSAVIYARFFLHAIKEEEEDGLLNLADRISKERSVQVAVEFRTHRDALMPKVTSAHYRRYIDPHQFLSKTLTRGFALKYYVDGFGFAKYGNDDAHVARVVLAR